MAFITKRLNRDETKVNIYDKLLYSETNKFGVFNTMKDIFLFALILGYSKSRREPLQKKLSFGPGIMQEEMYQQYFKLVALAVSEDPTVLIEEDSEGEYQTIIEEYVNGGIFELEETVIDKKGVVIDNFKFLVNYLNKKSALDGLLNF